MDNGLIVGVCTESRILCFQLRKFFTFSGFVQCDIQCGRFCQSDLICFSHISFTGCSPCILCIRSEIVFTIILINTLTLVSIQTHLCVCRLYIHIKSSGCYFCDRQCIFVCACCAIVWFDGYDILAVCHIQLICTVCGCCSVEQNLGFLRIL